MAFKMKGSSYKMGGHKTKATMAYMKNMKSPLEQASVDHQEIKDRLKGEDLTEAERQAILAKLKAAYEKEKEEESKEKAPTQMKSPLEQELSFMDKLSSVGDAFDRWKGPFGHTSIYDEYKGSKKDKRDDIRRENLGYRQEQRRDHRGQPYSVTVDKDGNVVEE